MSSNQCHEDVKFIFKTYLVKVTAARTGAILYNTIDYILTSWNGVIKFVSPIW